LLELEGRKEEAEDVEDERWWAFSSLSPSLELDSRTRLPIETEKSNFRGFNLLSD